MIREKGVTEGHGAAYHEAHSSMQIQHIDSLRVYVWCTISKNSVKASVMAYKAHYLGLVKLWYPSLYTGLEKNSLQTLLDIN